MTSHQSSGQPSDTPQSMNLSNSPFCEQVVLATASPRRHTLMSVAGLNYIILPADIDEQPQDDEQPKQYVERLAIEKGHVSGTNYISHIVNGTRETTSPRELPKNRRTLCHCEKKHLVISADTVVVHNNNILGKARDRDQAKQFLALLAGNSHQVLTGVAIHELSCSSGYIALRHHAVIATTVHMRQYTPHMITCYLDKNEWQGIAGSYTSQGAGAGLIASIEGSFSNVVGLPVSHLLVELDLILEARHR